MVDQSFKACALCGGQGTEVHHVFGGPNRKHSDKYKLVIRLCNRCHRQAHKDKALREKLRRSYQMKFESEYGHDLFMSVFGTNYLEPEQWKVTT